ncbi:hypothetical protein IAI10_17230 [Clostridium sp. 19966]|uniref:LuxE/PaaK family acyltransferase n=1 Tax=Clostridium sp. 19966 TaxID=2768166 RepID=UPI0028DE484D|nr:hypothetical protein [Clostridium sp. 19966]MDT8718413.1 hypothetical protein [Clostridium sp. 19966]
MDTAREKLFSYKKIYDQAGSEELFVEAMRESIQHHSNNCDFYRKLLKAKGFRAEEIKTIEDCEKIPPITAEFFKHHEVLSVDRSQIEIHATSSGTQGQKSQIFFDKESVRLGTKVAVKAMKYPSEVWPIDVQAQITWIHELVAAEELLGEKKLITDDKKKYGVMIDYNAELKASPLFRNIWVMPMKRKSYVLKGC